MPVFEVNDEDQSGTFTAVKFSHGAVNEDTKSQMSWKFYKKKRTVRKEKEKRIVTADLGDMKYVGKNFGSHPHSPNDTRDYYMGVLDKSTGKMRVIPAHLFQLEPFFEESETLGEANTDKTYREKMDELTKEFGSGRMQRAVLQRQKNALDTDMLSAATKSVAETSIVNEEVSGKANETIVTQTSAVPPHNKDAKRPEDVYKLKDIIISDIMGALSEQGKVFYDCTTEDINAWTREQMYPQFILNKLSTLSVREDSRKLQSQCLIYLNCLMTVYNMKAHKLRTKDPLPKEWQYGVKKHILDTFTSEIIEKGKKKRCCPSRLKDLMLSHILVLCLKLSHFFLNLNTLTTDLTIPGKRLMTHCSAIGCTVKSVKDPVNPSHASQTAELCIPLKFPDMKFHGKSKKQFR